MSFQIFLACSAHNQFPDRILRLASGHHLLEIESHANLPKTGSINLPPLSNSHTGMHLTQGKDSSYKWKNFKKVFRTINTVQYRTYSTVSATVFDWIFLLLIWKFPISHMLVLNFSLPISQQSCPAASLCKKIWWGPKQLPIRLGQSLARVYSNPVHISRRLNLPNCSSFHGAVTFPWTLRALCPV